VDRPLISIALGVRNGASTLPEALTSILQQTETDWELLVFDDGSSDATSDVVEEFASRDSRIRLFRDSTTRGLAFGLNQLVGEARGDLIARMDADDVAYPQRLEVQAAFLGEHPAIDLVGASMVVFRSDGSLWGRRDAPTAHERIAAHPYGAFRLYHPTWMGRAEWFRRHPYLSAADRAQDHELLYRALRDSTYANVPDILHGYREERVLLKASLRSRWSVIRHLAPTAFRRGRPDHVLLCGLGHLAKATADAVAVASRAHQRMLPWRARPVDPSEETEWQRVWASVHR
jgi:glycosyltransferase involved in cell wall biosynthesis